jgi:hypothetical protein
MEIQRRGLIIENNLGSYDWESFFDCFNDIDHNDESFRESMLQRHKDEMSFQANDLVEGVRECFREWVESIDVDDCERKIDFLSTDVFMTFNYTSTLQKVYGIRDDRIFHIHGNADAYDELVFGHNVEITERAEFDEEGNSLRTAFSDSEGAALYPLSAFKKPVTSIIDNNEGYFSSLNDVVEIIVIGHSLNDIDLPYFEAIARNASKAFWKVTYHNSSELKWFEIQLEKVGVDQERRKVCYLE